MAVTSSVQSDKERKTDTKHNQGNQQVAVGEDCLDLLDICHPHPIRTLLLNLGKHIGVAIPLSTPLRPWSAAGSAKWPEEV
jgi:hypothetical protein